MLEILSMIPCWARYCRPCWLWARVVTISMAVALLKRKKTDVSCHCDHPYCEIYNVTLFSTQRHCSREDQAGNRFQEDPPRSFLPGLPQSPLKCSCLYIEHLSHVCISGKRDSFSFALLEIFYFSLLKWDVLCFFLFLIWGANDICGCIVSRL